MFKTFDRFHWSVLALIGFYCLFYLVARSSFFPILTLDESEMLVLIQNGTSSLWGHQPPLYLYLQRWFVDLFGISRLALFSLKYSLLFFTYVFIFLTAVLVFEDKRKILLVLCGYLSLNTFADTLHNLTHTLLLAFAVSFFVFIVVALRRKQAIHLYALLGLSIGIGVFSKYNFIIVLGAAFAAAMLVREFRPVFITPRFFIALIVAALCVVPFVDSIEHAFEVFYLPRVNSGGRVDYGYLYSFYDYLSSLINFAFPFLAFVILLFRKTLSRENTQGALAPYRRYFGYMILLAVMVMAMQIVVLGPMHFKSRWHICSLFLLPFFVFAGTLDGENTGKKIRLFVALALVLTVGRFAYFFVGYSFDICTECSYLFHINNVVRSLSERHFTKGVLISNSYNILGRLKLFYPDSYVFPHRAQAPRKWQKSECAVILRKEGDWQSDPVLSSVKLRDSTKTLMDAAYTTSIEFKYREAIPVVYFIGTLEQEACVVE